jgi:hypothetical protein
MLMEARELKLIQFLCLRHFKSLPFYFMPKISEINNSEKEMIVQCCVPENWIIFHALLTDVKGTGNHY